MGPVNSLKPKPPINDHNHIIMEKDEEVRTFNTKTHCKRTITLIYVCDLSL